MQGIHAHVRQVEEFLWLLAFAILCFLSALLLTNEVDETRHRDSHQFLFHFCAISAVYCLYMSVLDVPLYLDKYATWTIPRLSVREGIPDSMSCKLVTKQTADWSGEMLWLTGYFSGAVWLSQHLERRRQQQGQHKER